MSMLIAVAVLDQKVGAFSPPMFVRSRGEGIRSFLDACGDPKTSLHSHPEDYQLFVLGSFEDSTGALVPQTPELLVAGEARK